MVEFKGSWLKQGKATLSNRDVEKLFIAYELDTWSGYLSGKFALGDCLFGTVKLTKNANPDKYGYSSCGYGIGFNARSKCSLSISEYGKSVLIFGVDNSFKKGYLKKH